MKKISLITLALVTHHLVQAQEFNARVTIIASRITTQVDKRIFNTLQTQLTNLINNRKWTEDNYKPNERINCNFIINLDRQEETNVYVASMTIQAARPVYHSTYQSPLVNWQDNDIAFRYVEFQPVEFNLNRLSGTDGLNVNLPAAIAYYLNIILGMDYNSFSMKGGEQFFKNALAIVNNAPSGRFISGWTQFDGQRNRYWLAENMLNSRYTLLNDAMYQYYRNGMDVFFEDETRAREEMAGFVNLMHSFNTSNPNTMALQFIMQSKADELIEVFKKLAPDQKRQMVELLSKIDVANSKKYREQLR